VADEDESDFVNFCTAILCVAEPRESIWFVRDGSFIPTGDAVGVTRASG
jgi:hypothetical protein